MKPGLLYRFLKWYVPLGFRFYYRKMQLSGVENVPSNRPVIFAINHQNAFMDAIVIACTTQRNPWFITRASVFRSSIARYWLEKLQMLPIYRFRDGHAEMKKNDEAMDAVQQLLQQKEAILIFPEGNHDRKWALRPLQKGIARMAFALEMENHFESGLVIVPVGLQYEDHLRSGMELLVSYGKAIETSGYKDLYHLNPAKAINLLLKDLEAGMKPLMLHIRDTASHDEIRKAVRMRKDRESNLQQRLIADQAFIHSWETGKVEKVNVNIEQTSSCSIFLKPFYYLALLLHLPALLLVQRVVQKTVKDDHWTSSIKFAVMIFGAPLIYLLQGMALALLGLSWPWLFAYGIALPLTGKIVISFRGKCFGK